MSISPRGKMTDSRDLSAESDVWTEESRKGFRAATQLLVRALEKYGVAIEGSKPNIEWPELSVMQSELDVAVKSYIDAHYDFTEELPPLLSSGSLECEDDENDATEGDVPASAGGTNVTVAWRADFRIENENVVIDEGRRVCAELNPGFTSAEVSDDVSNIGRALYWIDHAQESLLYEAAGLVPLAAVKWFLAEPEEVLTEEGLDSQHQDPFAFSEDFRSRMIYYIVDV
jgi:hypothetical protein